MLGGLRLRMHDALPPLLLLAARVVLVKLAHTVTYACCRVSFTPVDAVTYLNALLHDHPSSNVLCSPGTTADLVWPCTWRRALLHCKNS